MRSVRRKQLRYGLPAGVLLFAAGWASIAFLTPETVFPNQPRWRVTLWIYLGSHFVELSDVYTGGIGAGGHTVAEFAPIVWEYWLPVVPVTTVALASLYTCREMGHTRRMENNIRNAVTAGTGYFGAGLLAMIISDVQPVFSTILGIGLFAVVAILLGSRFIGAVTRSLPFIGITTLGTIAMIGLLLLIGGLALLNVIWGMLLISFGVPFVVGLTVGTSRRLEERGRKQGDSKFPRLHGIKWVSREYAKEIAGTIVVLSALVIGLR